MDNSNNNIVAFLDENNKPLPVAVDPSLQQYAVTAPALGFSAMELIEIIEEFLDQTTQAMGAVAELSAETSQLSLDASNNQAAILKTDNEAVSNSSSDDDSMQKAQSQFSTDQTAYQVPITVLQGLTQLVNQLQTTVAQAESMVSGIATSTVSMQKPWGTAS